MVRIQDPLCFHLQLKTDQGHTSIITLVLVKEAIIIRIQGKVTVCGRVHTHTQANLLNM